MNDLVPLRRRTFLLGGLALAGCGQMPGLKKPEPTLTYDGRYEILVIRVVNDTEANRSSPNKKIGDERQLARLVAVANNGTLRLVAAEDDLSDVGPNYDDFAGHFAPDGTLSLRTTTSYFSSKRSPGQVQVSQQVGSYLLAGNQVTVQGENFSDNWGVILRIRKI